MEPRDDSDEELMRQVARGDPEAMNALLRRYASPLLTFIRRTVGRQQRAEDLFQEVFLAVWVWRRRYRYPRPFRPWLFGIALNKCRAELRRQSYTPALLDDCPAGSPAAADPAPPRQRSPRKRPRWSPKRSADCPRRSVRSLRYEFGTDCRTPRSPRPSAAAKRPFARTCSMGLPQSAGISNRA